MSSLAAWKQSPPRWPISRSGITQSELYIPPALSDFLSLWRVESSDLPLSLSRSLWREKSSILSLSGERRVPFFLSLPLERGELLSPSLSGRKREFLSMEERESSSLFHSTPEDKLSCLFLEGPFVPCPCRQQYLYGTPHRCPPACRRSVFFASASSTMESPSSTLTLSRNWRMTSTFNRIIVVVVVVVIAVVVVAIAPHQFVCSRDLQAVGRLRRSRQKTRQKPRRRHRRCQCPPGTPRQHRRRC